MWYYFFLGGGAPVGARKLKKETTVVSVYK